MVGLLLAVDSKTFIKKFIEKEILEDYHYVSISESITVTDSNSSVKNRVSFVKSLYPPTQLVNLNINGDVTGYYNAYVNYLASPEIFPLILTIVRGLLNGMNIVLVFSDDDLDSAGDFYRIIGVYIEETFGLKLHTYDEYLDDKKGCLKQPEDMDNIIKNFYDAVEWSKTHKSDKQIKEECEKTKKQLEEELKDLSSKDLKKICKELDLVYDKSLTKKQIRKQIIKKVCKRIKKENKGV